MLSLLLNFSSLRILEAMRPSVSIFILKCSDSMLTKIVESVDGSCSSAEIAWSRLALGIDGLLAFSAVALCAFSVALASIFTCSGGKIAVYATKKTNERTTAKIRRWLADILFNKDYPLNRKFFIMKYCLFFVGTSQYFIEFMVKFSGFSQKFCF